MPTGRSSSASPQTLGIQQGVQRRAPVRGAGDPRGLARDAYTGAAVLVPDLPEDAVGADRDADREVVPGER